MGQPVPSQRPAFNFATVPTASKILLGAGLLLFIDCFLPWQSAKFGIVTVSAGALSGSASWAGLLMFLLLIALLVWEALSMFGALSNVQLPVAPSMVSAGLAAGVLFFGLLKVIFVFVDGSIGFATFVGIILLLAIGYGAYMKWSEAKVVGGPGAPPGPPPGGGGFSA